MAEEKTLSPQEKKELRKAEERTVPGRFYLPTTDIHETAEELVVVMDMPGVEKDNLDINLKEDRLSVEGRVALSDYDGLEPLYTEYNVGHYARTFRLSREIDQGAITAQVADGILTLHLKKAQAARPRRIDVT